jgi:predicted kinase
MRARCAAACGASHALGCRSPRASTGGPCGYHAGADHVTRCLQKDGSPRQTAQVGQARLYLVCGLPGAGKTTRSQQVVDSVGAVHLSPDEWIVRLGISLIDYEFRIKLQDCMLEHAGRLLRCGVSVVIEFGSWHRAEREKIRQVAVREGATTELHFVDAPLDELVRRVRNRGGPEAEVLASKVLLESSGRFERPLPEETSVFDRFFGPEDEWEPEENSSPRR